MKDTNVVYKINGLALIIAIYVFALAVRLFRITHTVEAFFGDIHVGLVFISFIAALFLIFMFYVSVSEIVVIHLVERDGKGLVSCVKLEDVTK